MNKHFKNNERELVKVATFFKRQSKMLIGEGKLGEEHKKVEEAVDRFVEQMSNHADARGFILEQREQLKKLVKDEPECPRCHTRDMLKFTGTERNEKGWQSNRYKCRRCNIQFTWNRPNNPWDMILYIEEVLTVLRLKHDNVAVVPEEKEQLAASIAAMQANLDKLKPVIDAHNRDYHEMLERDTEMERLIHEFKNSLLIEKIKMDTWENKKKVHQ
jgi:DNA-directed RNA polymerase subunit M/transcription elongation factor TFIIS